jgi:hypothetical protein
MSKFRVISHILEKVRSTPGGEIHSHAERCPSPKFGICDTAAAGSNQYSVPKALLMCYFLVFHYKNF